MLTVAELERLAKNTGCSEHNDCLTCPLPECIYITGKPRASVGRYEKIRYMYPAKSVRDIASELGVSIRTVQRALKEELDG